MGPVVAEAVQLLRDMAMGNGIVPSFFIVVDTKMSSDRYNPLILSEALRKFKRF